MVLIVVVGVVPVAREFLAEDSAGEDDPAEMPDILSEIDTLALVAIELGLTRVAAPSLIIPAVVVVATPASVAVVVVEEGRSTLSDIVTKKDILLQ